MKKTLLSAAVATTLGFAATGAQAVLSNGSVLNFGGASSCFNMGGSSSCPTLLPETTGQALTSLNGIVLGTTQSSASGASGTSGGATGDIDNPWIFYSNTGVHKTTSPTNVLSASGNTGTVDFSGWAVSWSAIATIPMGTGAWLAGTSNGVANVVCGTDCAVGDTYTLTYSATVPDGDPSGFGNVKYHLQLAGTIGEGTTVIPVPAAVWLFGSGLVGLVGVARRKKAA